VEELIQFDGCEHHWFEDRAPMCTVLVFVDNAASRLMEVKFTGIESTFTYFEALREHLERYGKPLALYRGVRPFSSRRSRTPFSGEFNQNPDERNRLKSSPGEAPVDPTDRLLAPSARPSFFCRPPGKTGSPLTYAWIKWPPAS
jgi:hypothetical protein